MGITKSDEFSTKQNKISKTLKALGHPARIAIIEHIVQSKSCICNELVDELPLAQPTISQHLKELKNVDIIKGTIEGKTVCYCINEDKIKELIEYFKNLSSLNNNPKCC